jgi:hypothetical protein
MDHGTAGPVITDLATATTTARTTDTTATAIGIAGITTRAKATNGATDAVGLHVAAGLTIVTGIVTIGIATGILTIGKVVWASTVRSSGSILDSKLPSVSTSSL